MLTEIKNSRGRSFFLADNEEVARFARALVMFIDSRHGAHIESDGTYQCAPMGTPNYTSIAQAISYATQYSGGDIDTLATQLERYGIGRECSQELIATFSGGQCADNAEAATPSP